MSEGEAEEERERESQAGSMPSAEPDMGLDPMTARSWPEPKSRVRQLTEPPRCPETLDILKPCYRWISENEKGRTSENSSFRKSNNNNKKLAKMVKINFLRTLEILTNGLAATRRAFIKEKITNFYENSELCCFNLSSTSALHPDGSLKNCPHPRGTEWSSSSLKPHSQGTNCHCFTCLVGSLKNFTWKPCPWPHWELHSAKIASSQGAFFENNYR